MKNRSICQFVASIICVGWMSCTKTVDVPLNEASVQTIIEGIIDNSPGPYHVMITESVAFKSLNTYPGVSGALVSITDNTMNVTDTLTEISPGNYQTHILEAVSGHTYNMNVLSANKSYTASSTMPYPVFLDSISFEHRSGFGGNSIGVDPNFLDPAGVENYYTFKETVNSRKLKTTYVFDDRLSDGKYITQGLRADSSYIQIGDTVKVQMNCVSYDAWNYFNVLYLVNNSSAIGSVAPSNPTSNISNNALGYFTAQTSQTLSAVAR